MMKTIRKVLWIILTAILVLFLVAIGYYFVVTSGVSLSDAKLSLPSDNIVLYDANGEQIVSAGVNQASQTVRFESVPEKTKLAFVDTEDKRFFSHGGFDFKRIVKSAYNNLLSHSFKQGASTISQQLVKNTHLSQEKTLTRKLREWKLTRQLERKYSKEEILEKYLNVIYFGHNCFGLSSATDFYFGKTPDRLDLADSAILAGLVKSPNNYSPFKNPINCQKRKESVLSAMLKNGHVTEKEKQEAMEKPLPTAPNKRENNAAYAHCVFDELSLLSERHGFTVGGKIEIYTYFDPEAQATIEKASSFYADTDKSLVVLDVESNGYKAYHSTVNEINRLPGSLLKPLLVYAPALEENLITPATPILDEKINYAGYSPNNYDGVFHGYTSVRECLAKSLNIPAVKILESVGIRKAASYLEKLGLSVEKEDLSLALALGGMKRGFPLSKLASAYATLARGGTYDESRFISAIKINGKQIYHRNRTPARVFSEETAYLTTDMLKTASKTGTAKKLRSLPFEIAAKTGTVGTEKGNTDAYAVSYTQNDVVGVWLGNADNRFIEYTGGGAPCNLLLKINEALESSYQQQGKRIEKFNVPSTVIKADLDKISYHDAHTMYLADDLAPKEYRFTELFTKATVPTKKSSFFSKPTIISPHLEVENGKVIITLPENAPTIYQYKIERSDYQTNNTLYIGDYIHSYTDEHVEKDNRYIYTVTPIYQGRQGQTVTLPAVITKDGIYSKNDKEIVEKNWWDY